MLAIRLQRQGRKGYATYRFIVQEASRSPDSGRVVARIGSYNPHTKEVILDKEKAKFYLDNGAQPSDTVVKLFKSEKVKIPSWVEKPTKQKRKTKNPDKLRKNRPKEEQKPAQEAPADKEEPKQEEEQAPEEPKDENKPPEEPKDQSEETDKTEETEENPEDKPTGDEAKETSADKTAEKSES